MDKKIKLARQIAGSLAIEGMTLNREELDRLERCATGEQSTSDTIQLLLKKYTQQV